MLQTSHWWAHNNRVFPYIEVSFVYVCCQMTRGELSKVSHAFLPDSTGSPL